MHILHDILEKLKIEFASSRKGNERGIWFVYTIIAILVPFTSSKTSNILRCLNSLFGFSGIRKKRFYTFMASPKIPWKRLWQTLWRMIPDPLTDDRLLLALDDYINPKTGKKIFGCEKVFDHAAKQNQSKYPWAQNIVAVGLLKIVKGRWACLPLSYRFYHLKKSIEKINRETNGPTIAFETKLAQAAAMITEIAEAFGRTRILLITDSWFGNNGLWKPLHDQLSIWVDMISRLRSNNNVFELPEPRKSGKAGRPRKYGKKLGNVTSLANQFRSLATQISVNLYGRNRTVVAYERVVMLKTIRCAVKVVWIYRQTQWVALYSTDLNLSAQQIIEYYGARWKIEALFKELKRDIGSAATQTRNAHAVSNHLHFCMLAASVAWIYASRIDKTPERRHAVEGRNHFAFSDVRRSVTKAALDDNFSILFPAPRKSIVNSLVTVLLRMAA
jgi:DDE superfamily endonuclease